MKHKIKAIPSLKLDSSYDHLIQEWRFMLKGILCQDPIQHH